MMEPNAKDYWESLHHRSYGLTSRRQRWGADSASSPSWTSCSTSPATAGMRAFANLASLVKADGLLVSRRTSCTTAV
jgi:hypothetical protein